MIKKYELRAYINGHILSRYIIDNNYFNFEFNGST